MTEELKLSYLSISPGADLARVLSSFLRLQLLLCLILSSPRAVGHRRGAAHGPVPGVPLSCVSEVLSL